MKKIKYNICKWLLTKLIHLTYNNSHELYKAIPQIMHDYDKEQKAERHKNFRMFAEPYNVDKIPDLERPYIHINTPARRPSHIWYFKNKSK